MISMILSLKNLFRINPKLRLIMDESFKMDDL